MVMHCPILSIYCMANFSSQLCLDDYYEGTVQGLYFGGTCAAPEEVVCTYWS